MSIASLIDPVGSFNNIATFLMDGLASYTGLPQPAVSSQYETYAGGGAGLWLGAGSSPAVVVGDVFVGTLTTIPNGFVWTINPDGTIDIFAGGNTARQELLFGVYRVAGNAIDSGGIVWVNEIGPVWVSPVILSSLSGFAIPTVNLADPFYASSPEGDVLTFALSSGSFPDNVNLSGAGALSGIPTIPGTYSFTISATDSTGTSTISAPSSILVQALPPTPPVGTMPNFVGLEYFNALALIQSSGYIAAPPIEVKIAQSANNPRGFVVGQSIPPFGVASPGTPITLTVSKPNGQFPSVEQNAPIPYWYFFQS